MANTEQEESSEGATSVIAQLQLLWEKLSPRRKAVAAAALVATAVFIAALSFSGSVENYAPLYTGMSPEDAGELVSVLKEKGVSYKLSNGGTAVEVLETELHELRIELAAGGYPRGGAVGFEIFDKQSFGTTTFVEQVNYRRALQGELTRSVAAISAVKSARIHLAMGKRSVFRDSAEPPSASVALRLKSGRKLTAAEVTGIVNLVASSVDGLDPAKVVVIDENGKVLSSTDTESAGGQVADVQSRIESSLQERVVRLLERVVGVGNAAVVVTAEIDYSRVNKTEEMFDKENIAVRAEVRNVTRDPESNTVGGIAGARANLDGSGSATQEGEGGETSVAESRNFEVPRVLKHTVGPTSTIKKLHVAVLVNHKKVPIKNEEKPAAKDDAKAPDAKDAEAKGEEKAEEEAEGAEEEKFEMVALTAEELEVIEGIVRQAAGLDDERGDSLVVNNLLFEQPIEMAPEETMTAATPLISKNMYFAACGVLGLLLVVVVLLMIKKKSEVSSYARAKVMALPASISEVERVLDNKKTPAQLPGSTPHELEESQSANIYERVVGTVRSDAGHAARVISALLDEGAKEGA